MYDLPDQVITTLIAWDQLYDDTRNWDDPMSTTWPSREYYRNYIEQGRAAARLLRQHIPDDVRIEYCGDDNIPSEYY